MAAELVGGALVSSFLNVVFDRLTSPEVVKWVKGKKLNQRLLQKLETYLHVVQAVLNDAEQKQITDPAVKKWLTNLEDAVYMADDLLDEVSTKAAAQKHSGNILSRFLNLQDREMVYKIEEVIDTLETIAKHKDILGLKNIAMESKSRRIPSTSLVEKSDIYGRDEDKEAIIKLLLDDTRDAKISVIPIVGMGGVGKTTLAQLVYNDDKIKGKFDFTAWVCVGEEFDVLKMTKTVLEAQPSSSCNTNDLDLIQLSLKKKLIGKRFLVVLDDMWNDSYDDWNFFQIPFQYGIEGSKILVTTRNDKVACLVQTVQPYNLSLLSYEHCWLVFAKHAFLSPESRDYSSMEKIGRKIVEKCKGLPLAAQTLGGLLRTKDNARDWNDILKSEIWEFSESESRILPALRISYHHLPSYLKRCFVFCSLYPKDYQFDRDELVLLWMANDHLQSSNHGRTLEEIGYKYFNELASRSFFHPSNTDEGLFVMHDLMHDLAIFYATEFYLRPLELVRTAKVDIKTRYLSYDVRGNYPISKFLEACNSLKHVRTLLQINFSIEPSQVSREIAHSISLSQLKCLRVLSFKCFALDSLPDSIGELIHLRYLDLSKALIVTLPESLSILYNLQTLKLRYCERLKILPSNMQDLVNLRHLDITRTSLQEMPKGINKLKDLQFLSDYVFGRHDANDIRVFGALANLHGSLVIHKLENIITSGEASEARMIDKVHINDLKFNWSSCDSIVDFQIERDIVSKLQPFMDLKELSIRGYRGKIFPDWLGHSTYHNMTTLTISECKNCCMLPSLGQLPSLKHLEISKFDKLLFIGAKFYKNDEFCQETPFPSLETLKLVGMSSCLVWYSSQIHAFPQLKMLSIRSCPLLRGDLPNHLPSLKELYIYECNQLTCSLPSAPNSLKLKIIGTHKVRLEELPLSLCSLSVEGTRLVESTFEAMTSNQPTCLQSLYISDCSSAISFPGACMAASLKYLYIWNCKKLEFPMQQRQQQESLQLLRIFDSCDSLTSFPLTAFPNLTELEIKGSDNMNCLLQVSQSKDAPILSLRRLTINSFPNFVSLLSQSRNIVLPSLDSLSIRECKNFVSFSMLGKVAPQLEFLRVADCPKFDSFGEGNGSLPPSLRYLDITRCEKLVSSLASSTVLQSCGLTHLEIVGACDGVKSFPSEGCLPAAIKTLYLAHFPSLETLNCKGLLHLTSLEKLRVEDCPKLENIVGERLPASLKELSIITSPLLGELFWGRDLQIWPKISHIFDIKVDSRPISNPRSSTGNCFSHPRRSCSLLSKYVNFQHQHFYSLVNKDHYFLINFTVNITLVPKTSVSQQKHMQSTVDE